MKEKIKQLSIEEKVGQMFIIGVNKTNPIQLIENYILKNKVGGILLYKKNYKNLKELIDLVNYIKKINTVNPVQSLSVQTKKVEELIECQENWKIYHLVTN